MRGRGRGGRNQEIAAVAGRDLAERGIPAHEVLVLSAGTDGQDGPTDAAGGFGDGGLRERCSAAGVDLEGRLADSDSYGLLDATGDLLRTGLTGTNVMDLQIVLVSR